MLTDKDIKQLKDVLATKEDFSLLANKVESLTTKVETLATKDELKTLVTKVETLATKEELKTLATKEELKTLANKVETLATKDDMEAVRADIANHDHRFDELAESINKLHEDFSVKKDVERIKGFLREKLHAEI